MKEDTQFSSADRAASSVIGIILIVAVVVIAGAAVSVYALGVVSTVTAPVPQTSIDFTPDYETGDIIVTVNGGDALPGDQVKFAGAALEKTAYGGITEWAGTVVQAGDAVSVNVRANERLQLIWQSPDDGTEAVLSEYDVPSDVAPRASIGSVAGGPTWVNISTIQFETVNERNVYVVVTKQVGIQPQLDTVTNTEFSINGGDLNVTGLRAEHPRRSIRYTVTVYETREKSIELATSNDTYSGGGGITRP